MILELCEGSEDLTAEDKAAEILPINLQQLYVALRLGKTEEADALADEINVAEYVYTLNWLAILYVH